MFRFDRNYKLKVVVGGKVVTITPPMNIIFDADKSVSGFGLNKLNVKIPNLSESNRTSLTKDPEQQKRIPITLEVGYGDKLELIFKGTVHRAFSQQQGPDIISTLECIDGGYDLVNSYTEQTVIGRELAIQKIVGDMPNTTIGKLTIQGDTVRPHVLVGASYDQLLKFAGPDEQLFIDNEQLFIIKNSEVVSLFVPQVSSETGLSNAPVRENSIVTFETIMNTDLRIGGLCNIKSKLAKHLNGVHKINTINYSGEYDGEDWAQTVTASLSPNFTKVGA